MQMGDPVAAKRTCDYLVRCEAFGKPIQLKVSKQEYVKDSGVPPMLKDGTPSMKNYDDSRNQRFLTPEAAAKNRLCGPSERLYFFNSPPDITEEKIKEMCKSSGCPAPAEVKISTSGKEGLILSRLRLARKGRER